jgi:hypothetical protein
MIQKIKGTINKYKLPVTGGLVLVSPLSVPLVLNGIGLSWELSVAIGTSLLGINYTLLRMAK